MMNRNKDYQSNLGFKPSGKETKQTRNHAKIMKIGKKNFGLFYFSKYFTVSSLQYQINDISLI